MSLIRTAAKYFGDFYDLHTYFELEDDLDSFDDLDLEEEDDLRKPEATESSKSKENDSDKSRENDLTKSKDGASNTLTKGDPSASAPCDDIGKSNKGKSEAKDDEAKAQAVGQRETEDTGATTDKVGDNRSLFRESTKSDNEDPNAAVWTFYPANEKPPTDAKTKQEIQVLKTIHLEDLKKRMLTAFVFYIIFGAALAVVVSSFDLFDSFGYPWRDDSLNVTYYSVLLFAGAGFRLFSVDYEDNLLTIVCDSLVIVLLVGGLYFMPYALSSYTAFWFFLPVLVMTIFFVADALVNYCSEQRHAVFDESIHALKRLGMLFVLVALSFSAVMSYFVMLLIMIF